MESWQEAVGGLTECQLLIAPIMKSHFLILRNKVLVNSHLKGSLKLFELLLPAMNATVYSFLLIILVSTAQNAGAQQSAVTSAAGSEHIPLNKAFEIPSGGWLRRPMVSLETVGPIGPQNKRAGKQALQTPVNKVLHLNEIQVLGSHNSYKVAIDTALLNLIAAKDEEEARSLDYAHVPVIQQLNMGLRNLEYDIFHDPEGGRFANPSGLELLKKNEMPFKPFDKQKKLQQPGFKVFHIQDIDFRSHHLLFEDALNELREWSNTNPNHVPVFVTINAKDQQIKNSPLIKHQPLPFTESALDSIDYALKKHLGRKHLLTPGEVKNDGKTLKESVSSGSWPSLDSARGKFIFILDQNDEKMERYIDGHPSLEGRMMFVNAPESYPEAAVMIINDPIEDQEKIKEMVRRGFIVRTRADAGTKEARENDYGRWEAAKRSGAQIITTDYYLPSQTFPSPYQISMEGVFRENPVLR